MMASPTSPGTARLRAAAVGLTHGHMGTLNPAAPRGLLGTLRQLAVNEGIDIVAVCEPDEPGALEREVAYLPGARGYDSVEALVNEEALAFALVGLPAAESPRAVAALASRGVHCFVEKSPARTADEFVPVVEAARRSGAHVLIDYPWRHHPAVATVRELLTSGALGRPAAMLASMTTSQVGPLPGQRNPAQFPYRSASEGGGMLHWLGAHFLEVMCALFGDVRSVSALCAPVIGNMESDPRMDDVSSVSMRFESGAVGTLHTGYLNAVAGDNRDFIRVWGTDGDAFWPALGPQLVVGRRAPGGAGREAPAAGAGGAGGTASVQGLPPAAPAPAASPTQTRTFEITPRPGVYGNSDWMYELACSFVRGIRTGDLPEVGPREALRVLRIIDAAYEASRSGRTVELSTP